MAELSEKARSKLNSLNEALESGAMARVRRIINSGLAPVDVAHLIESSPPKARKVIWELVDKGIEGEVLQYLSIDIQSQFLSDMSAEQVVDATADLDSDDIADMLQQLPEQVTQEILSSMDHQDRARVEAILGYPEDSAGGLMNTDTITIRPDITLDVVLRYLRRHQSLPDMTDNLLVVNRQNEFIGALPIRKLLVSDPQQTVREVMSTGRIMVIQATQHETEVAKLFERHDLVSAPVVDANGMLLGRITIDDVVDVIRETADHSLMSMAGLDDDEDTFAPVLKTARRRAVWLGINLITAFIASAVIGLFDKAIEAVVALAVLMPIVASMGGIAGSQVLTLVIRGQALGHLSGANFRWLFHRELLVAALNGGLWAIIIAIMAWVWFNDIKLSLIMSAAIIINLMAAAVVGAALPQILKARGIDPALAGGVILTTVTDVVGFMSFLGLATLIYI
ncbi:MULTISPECIES: magnesium transporter [unclassified Oceanobacter]|jgi:magnesium transporter|uniref:magnesium transporter n=1 Tax=unclassified Oceanobacter TaxID=2620260 RepID=UPI0026E46511|nr:MULTISPECIES: magnesium transporter [unclassified Oceanobacter]MDO6681991.1 magnesium transporter [Oceanobacter sp. 5_MG-2023]MDP2505353.1 magnesium transporter [Oceanobacter sp. 3_MG-2023]MDP2548027.1 magnesium transporter [Oceanobacter sp. 4_MG-2023]MDP2610119.1 magnesium transporter [Oceanobacter sp. 1_MG-2023]MDP2612306.1 magnesium transporter [Oceanobacter sp. 2_MG-2023]